MAGNIITEFVGLRAKQYAYKTEEKNVIKCKGISKNGMNEIFFEDYMEILNGKTITTKMNVIRPRNHNLYSETVTKKIDGFDEKREILKNGIDTVPWGYNE